MIRSLLPVFLAGTGLLLTASTVLAHHSQSAEFDRNKPLEFTGTVQAVGWVNSHGYVVIEAEGADGKAIVYEVEIGAPNGLYRAGWRKESLKTGTVIEFAGWRSRDPESLKVAGQLTLPDGTVAYRGTGPLGK